MALKIKIEYLPVELLTPNPDNPRIINENQFKKLCQSLKDNPEYFEARPILVNKDMVIFAGNMRHRAAQKIGLKEVPVVIMDITKEKEKELMIRDNRENGFWDWDRLANEWEINKLLDWGFTEYELKIDLDLDREELWNGPEFNQPNLVYKSLIVNFLNEDDLNNFSQLVKQKITFKTKSIWYPESKNEPVPIE